MISSRQAPSVSLRLMKPGPAIVASATSAIVDSSATSAPDRVAPCQRAWPEPWQHWLPYRRAKGRAAAPASPPGAKRPAGSVPAATNRSSAASSAAAIFAKIVMFVVPATAHDAGAVPKSPASARDVVLQLVLVQLKADQQFERGPRDRGARTSFSASGSMAASSSPARRRRVIRSRISSGQRCRSAVDIGAGGRARRRAGSGHRRNAAPLHCYPWRQPPFRPARRPNNRADARRAPAGAARV